MRDLAKTPEPGETWRHYKGDLYRVLHLGIDVVQDHAVVIYQKAGAVGVPIWVRPLESWMWHVEPGLQRFTFAPDE